MALNDPEDTADVVHKRSRSDTVSTTHSQDSSHHQLEKRSRLDLDDISEN